MKLAWVRTNLWRWQWAFLAAVVGVTISFAVAVIQAQPAASQQADQTLVSVYDRGETQTFLTRARTIGAALQEKNITVTDRDVVEPSVDEELLASNYRVNIYRARPVVVVDGALRLKATSARQTPEQIASDLGLEIFPEDKLKLSRSTNFLADGAGLRVDIKRAVPVILELFGRRLEVRTQGDTVAALLKEKNIIIGAQDRVSLDPSTPIAAGMFIRVWREGKQTITVDQPVSFSREIIYDMDRPLKYRAIKTPGAAGVRTITYDIEIVGGVEVSRTQIASLVASPPQMQIEVIGLRNDGSGLSKSKGAQYVADSKGVVHRETYYDLDMSVVMNACGQGGKYSVRPDGAKVDADGYILVAANYGRYPRCSIVETSLGLGKVYDTGGFALRYPDGFDLATDWTNSNGR